MTKTDWACLAFRATGALGARSLMLRLTTGRELVILAYHRVAARLPAADVYDPGVVSCSGPEFEREMAFVKAHFDIVSFRDLDSDRASTARRPLIVTFDDGYKDNCEVAWPILRRLGLRATFFITTGFIGTGEMPWWDEMEYLIRRGGGVRLTTGPWVGEDLAVDSDAGADRASRVLLAASKEMPDSRRVALLQSLREQCGGRPATDKNLMMTWPDIRALAADGMEIGSHTVTHPVLGNVEDPARLESELSESRRRLQSETGTAVDALSYPVGKGRTVTEGLVAAVKAAGYRYACLYEHGVNPRQGYDPLRLRRIKTEVGENFPRFRAKICFPNLVRY